MSPRVTRSAARLAEESSTTADNPPAAITQASSSPPKPRKRKAPDPDSSPPAPSSPRSSTRRSKKARTSAGEVSVQNSKTPSRSAAKQKSMAKPGSSSGPADAKEKSPPPATDSSKRKSSSRSKKTTQDPESTPSASHSTGKRSRKHGLKKWQEASMADAQDSSKAASRNDQNGDGDAGPSGDSGLSTRRPFDPMTDTDGDDDALRAGGFLSGPGGLPASMSSTLRALSGYVSGAAQRLRDILDRLRQKDDPSVQLIALQELSEILLVSNEDNLSGQFAPDQVVRELITLLQPNEQGEENPEMMLLACRCIANLMEALPQSTGNVVYAGAVPILCQKLLEIHFIDLAEQALSTLEKISVEFPSSIVREGGLTACLTYLDFFATSTQRTAVTTAANCCKNIPQDSFPVVRDVMPILLNVLSSNDQKVVEQGSICVSRVVESFRYQQNRLEDLVSVDLLKAVRRLLQPGTTNLIGAGIHTQFLRVLSIVAHSSPKLSTELLKMAIVDTIYQILTGVSPPSGTENVASQIDSVFVMQALIHRPRDQVTETLNVICDLLPAIQADGLSYPLDGMDEPLGQHPVSRLIANGNVTNVERLDLLKGCQQELRRFAIVLFPTLTDAFSSTVNLSVRQKVLTAQLKMLSNLDVSILEEALRSVPYASFLASILSQQDHPTLVNAALTAADLLLKRLFNIYGYQFYREGVMAEIANIAAQTPVKEDLGSKLEKSHKHEHALRPDSVEIPEPADAGLAQTSIAPENDDDHQNHDEEVEDEESDDEDEEAHEQEDEENEDGDEGDEDVDHDDEEEDEERQIIQDRDMLSPSSTSSSEPISARITAHSDRGLNILHAKQFLQAHETDGSRMMRDKAAKILKDLQSFASALQYSFPQKAASESKGLFQQLASYFHGNALETITSSELLHSDVIDALLQTLGATDSGAKSQARSEFLEVFMKPKVDSNIAVTPLNVFVHKLQDLLSRSEHFEVVTVHQNALDRNRSSPSSMLSKQLRIRLVAENESETPKQLRYQIISIHAIATFKALDDYLRPRLALGEHRTPRSREGISSALAAFAAAAGVPPSRLSERLGITPGDLPSTPPPPSTATESPSVENSRDASKSGAASGEPKTPKDKNTSGPRRSSRRHHRSAGIPVETPTHTPEVARDPLECADERQVGERDEMDDTSALDAIVDDLDDDMDGDQAPEPSAVNMEVASTGKVTARKEDGTNIPTPAPNTPTGSRDLSQRRAELLAAAGAAGLRDMSYAAAVQSVPQDWHLEFSLEDDPVSNDTTIYRAVQTHDKSSSSDLASRNIWSATHVVKFKKVKGPPPSETSWPPKTALGSLLSAGDELPQSLTEHPTTTKILRLLKILHEMNANIDHVLEDEVSTKGLNAEPLSIFVNTKLTAKLNRQMEEPLIVASNCLPDWTHDLCRLFPFLFPFETRHLFLQSTSFGYARSMTRWWNQTSDDTRRDRHREDRPFQGRLQRQKVRLSRTRILESASKVMEMYSGSSSVLEVEYFGEVGTGLGPTLEFYSSVSKEFSKKKIKMWRDMDSNEADEYIFNKQGLFPAPMTKEMAESEAGKRTLYNFKLLGRFIARSMLDSRIIDVSLNPMFFTLADPINKTAPSLATAKSVDSGLAKSLKLLKQYVAAKSNLETSDLSAKQKMKGAKSIEINGATVDDLSLDFTLPGYPGIELVPGGSNMPVTIDNVSSFVDNVLNMTLGSGIQRQLDSFRAGFSDAFPYTSLNAFTPSELVMLFGRTEEDWSMETLLDSIKADHGFNMDSRSVRNLLQVMSELDPTQRRDFLQFVTGSPKLPIGGFKALSPMFTVVCKPSEPPYTSDDFLISVMTCANYVKLPDYTSLEILRKRLFTAIQEGQGAFLLS